MEFAPPNLNISKLKRKLEISNLTLQIAVENLYRKGRFCLLWRDGNFLVIQAEPWWRPGYDFAIMAQRPLVDVLEEHRALWHTQEVIQTMLDGIEFDGENNWAYLIYLPKRNKYRLVYAKRQLVPNCMIWTKVVELGDIEITQFTSGLCWEGIYEDKEVDLFIAWQDEWGAYVSAESHGQKLIESRGLGRYFFELKAHVAKNGVIVGIMMEALVGRYITPADRSAVFEAVADIQRHGVFFLFQMEDIYITERGVRFASASSAKYYEDRDALALEAERAWKILADIFASMGDNSLIYGERVSRSGKSCAFIMPRLPSPGRTIPLTTEEALIRWVWSITTSDEFCRSQHHAFKKLHALYSPSPLELSMTCRGKRIGDGRALLANDDFSGDSAVSVASTESGDEPLVVINRIGRFHPYARPTKFRLPQESDPVARSDGQIGSRYPSKSFIQI